MPGNTTSLYSSTGSSATVSGTNTSGLYGTSGTYTVGTTAYGNVNVAAFLQSYTGNLQAGNATILGNLAAGGVLTDNYYYANGAPISFAGTYGNANVANFLPTYTGNLAGGNAVITGAITGATVSASGNITGNYILGNGSQLTGLPQQYGNANVAAFLPTYTGNLQAGNLETINDANINNDLYVGGTIYGTFSGNISGNLVVPGANTDVIFNNGGNAGASSDFTFNDATNVMTVNGTANVNTLNATGNITGGNITGTGLVIAPIPTGVQTFITGTGILTYGDVNAYLGNVTGANLFGTIRTASQPNITTVGTLGSLAVTGNVTAGNISGANIIGNGSFLTNLPGANVTGTVANATYALNANAATFAGTVTTNAQPNITSVGNLTSLTVTGDAVIGGNLEVDGNVTYIASNVVTINDKFINVANNAATASQADGGGLGVGPIGAEYATWTFDNGNTTWDSNLGVAAPSFSATGNVTGQYIIGDGSLLTNINAGNITGAYGNANVSNFLATGFGSNTITTTGNITANTFVGQLNGNVIEPLQFGIENIGNPTNVTTVYGNGVGIQSYTDQDINILSTTTNSHITMVTFGSGVASDINIGALGGATANVRIRGANLNAEQNISATGNVTAVQFNGNLQGKVLDSSQTGIQLIGNNSSATSTAIFGNGISILPLAESDMFILATGANTDIVIGGSGANANGALYVGKSPLGSSPMPTVLSSDDTYVQGNLRNNLGNIAIIDNVDITGAISATGNVTGSYILGNGSQLTGLPATYGNANVSNFLANGFGSNNITTTGNIITGNILTDGYYYANGTPFTGSGSSYGNANVSNFLANGFGSNNITTTGNIAVNNISMTGNLTNPSGAVKIPDDIIMGGSQPVTISGSTGQFKVEAGVGSFAANIYNGDSSGSGLTIQAGATASQTILDLRNVYGVSIANVQPGNGFQLSGQILASGNITGEYFIGNGSALTGVVASGLGGNMAANISGVNLYNISGLTSLSATSVATDTISSPSGDFVNIEGVISGAGLQSSGNAIFYDQKGISFQELQTNGSSVVFIRAPAALSQDYIYQLPNSYGSNAQVLTTDGTGNMSWTTVSGGSGSPGGSDTQIQFNDAGSFGGNANVTFNKTTGNMAIGNIVFASGTTNTNANNQTFNNWIQCTNDHIGNSATANTYTPGRYLFGKGLGGTPGSGGIPGYFGVNVDQDGSLRNARVAIADRYTLTDTGVRNAGLMVYNWIDVSGNINSANTNTRVNGIISALNIGGNGSGNLVSTSTNPYRGYNAAINIGTTGNVNVGNIIATTVVGYNSFINVNSGSELKNAVHYVAGPSGSSGSTTGNSFGLVHQFSSSVAYNKIALVNMQNSSGNGWGQNSTLPTTYLFLDNTDTRSSSLVGPIKEYYDRPYTFVTTTGSTNLDWNNGTSQYLKPTGNVTLDFTNALTNSNGNLFHTVTLVVEQGTTPYTITLPTANATIKYAGGVSTPGATANAVIMITSTAANINGSTTYLTTVSPEFL
jgi:hypothetical protein